MESSGTMYTPQSPDVTGYHSFQTPLGHPSQQRQYRGSVVHPSPYAPKDPYAQNVNPSRKRSMPQSEATATGTTTGTTTSDDGDNEWLPDASEEASAGRAGRRSAKVKREGTGSASGGGEGVEVKTKFPVARIKRIMQADEDVGKVAQVTPVVVSKALELFMVALVTKAAAEAKSRSSKRVSAAHFKEAVLKDDQFDFLRDIVSKVSDAPTAGEKQEDTDEMGEGAGVKRRRGGGRRKRQENDDF